MGWGRSLSRSNKPLEIRDVWRGWVAIVTESWGAFALRSCFPRNVVSKKTDAECLGEGIAARGLNIWFLGSNEPGNPYANVLRVLTALSTSTARLRGRPRWQDYVGSQRFTETCAPAAGNQIHSSHDAVSGTRSACWSTADRWAGLWRGVVSGERVSDPARSPLRL